MAQLAHAMSLTRGGRRVPVLSALIVLVAWTIGAISPRYPRAWLLENLPLFAALPFLWALRGRLSDRAWIQIAAFLVLHVYGAHYTYANTPIGFWVQGAFELSRNHYDRFVHFAFGLLTVRPFRELLPQPTLRRELLVAVVFVSASSLTYEQIEWVTALFSDPAAGVAFLGAQGDVWDAQKDTTCATAGSLLGALLEWRLSRRAA